MADKAFKIWNCKTKEWMTSGRSLYGRPRSVWANLAGARNTLNKMPAELKSVCVIREFQMVETPESLSRFQAMQHDYE